MDDIERERMLLKLERAALGRFADPSDVGVYIDPETLDPDDDDAIGVAVADLLEAKPYLAGTRQQDHGSIDQGFAGDITEGRAWRITRTDLQKMSPDEIIAARMRGQLDHLLRGDG